MLHKNQSQDTKKYTQLTISRLIFIKSCILKANLSKFCQLLSSLYSCVILLQHITVLKS